MEWGKEEAVRQSKGLGNFEVLFLLFFSSVLDCLDPQRYGGHENSLGSSQHLLHLLALGAPLPSSSRHLKGYTANARPDFAHISAPLSTLTFPSPIADLTRDLYSNPCVNAGSSKQNLFPPNSLAELFPQPAHPCCSQPSLCSYRAQET